MSVGLVWAQAANGVIGADGGMPWHLPEDLAHFRELTMGATVVMGRRTWESFPDRFRPLPGRVNIVLTRAPGWSAPGAVVRRSLDDALARTEGAVWVIGGTQVFESAMPYAGRAVVTELADELAGDTVAPVLDGTWELESRDPSDGWHRSSTGLAYRIATYVRTVPAR